MPGVLPGCSSSSAAIPLPLGAAAGGAGGAVCGGAGGAAAGTSGGAVGAGAARAAQHHAGLQHLTCTSAFASLCSPCPYAQRSIWVWVLLSHTDASGVPIPGAFG